MTPPRVARPDQGGRRRRRPLALRLLAGLLAAAALAYASAEPLPADVADLLAEARFAVDEAFGRDDPRTPDHPGWREGLAIGRRALALAPHPDVHRFLGRTYGLVGWSVRALVHFDALLAAGESLDDPPDVAASEVPSTVLYGAAAADLAFARYGVGDLDGAVAIYERWLTAVPDSLEAVRWLGRLLLERHDPDAALPYWERLAEALPDDEAAAFYLGEARRGAVIGPQASGAYRSGLTAYEAGALAEALQHFEAAAAAAPAFVDAAVWAGRTALELQLPALAATYWERVVAARPDDGGAAYFLRVARDQERYGVPAGRAFHAGLASYQRGEPEAAVDAFEAAVAANDGFLEAWVWLARVRQEIGRYDASVTAWERVVSLDPEDDRARYFLNIARQQRGVRAEAGVVFAEGIIAFEASDLATAEARFVEAVAIDPDAVQAWVWLGRVAFSLQRYEDAAASFARAAALDPDDDDIAFFAAESAMLAAPPQVVDGPPLAPGDGPTADEGEEPDEEGPEDEEPPQPEAEPEAEPEGEPEGEPDGGPSGDPDEEPR